MKRFLIVFFIIIPALFGFAVLSGITPAYMASAPGVATGIGAKLLCSARYVSGYSEEQAMADLVQYSPVLDYLSVSYDDEARVVETSLYGLRRARASHVEGIGCAIDHPGFDERYEFEARDLPVLQSRWPHGTRITTIDEGVQSRVDEMIARDNAEGLDTRALLVVRGREVVAEAYAGGAGPDMPLLGWSMAKSLTSLMIGNLELRGLLDVEETPGFLEWADDERADIRIADMLTMTDGLAFIERYDPGFDATAMLFTEPGASAYALTRPVLHEPGVRFNYSSGTANLLSRVYYERSGGDLQSVHEDYIRHIVLPISLQHTVFEVDATGVFKGSSYVYASAQDWARLGQLMLDGGVINGRRIVSEEWVERSVMPNPSSNAPAYGYQWWLNRGDSRLRWPDLPEDAFAAQGNREQYLMVIPSEDTVIVRLGWSDGAYPANERFASLLR